jgi:hypothetical protein
MNTQARNETQTLNPDRGRPDALAKTAADAVAESLMTPIFPAPTAPQAETAVAGGGKSWFSLATVFTILALAACAAAGVAAVYGPVFTQPLNGP